MSTEHDDVHHPKHYTSHPSGVECIEITEHFNFCLGNAIKYIWRAGLKGEDAVQDLQKAIWYVQREISRLESDDINWDEIDEIIAKARAASAGSDLVEEDEQTADGDWTVVVFEGDDDNVEIRISK